MTVMTPMMLADNTRHYEEKKSSLIKFMTLQTLKKNQCSRIEQTVYNIKNRLNTLRFVKSSNL